MSTYLLSALLSGVVLYSGSTSWKKDNFQENRVGT